jgi:hypothetical protein
MGRCSETLTEHVMSPRNTGVIESPDLVGHAGAPGRGAFLVLFLKVHDESDLGGEVPDLWLRADYRIRVDAYRTYRGPDDQRVPHPTERCIEK